MSLTLPPPVISDKSLRFTYSRVIAPIFCAAIALRMISVSLSQPDVLDGLFLILVGMGFAALGIFLYEKVTLTLDAAAGTGLLVRQRFRADIELEFPLAELRAVVVDQVSGLEWVARAMLDFASGEESLRRPLTIVPMGGPRDETIAKTLVEWLNARGYAAVLEYDPDGSEEEAATPWDETLQEGPAPSAEPAPQAPDAPKK